MQITPNFSQSVRNVKVEKKQMMSVEHDGNQRLVKINSSSLSVIQACPRKSQYMLHERWAPKSGSPALVYGKAMHKALETFYSMPLRERELPDDFESVSIDMADGLSTNDSHPIYETVRAFLAEGESLRELPGSDKRSLTAGVWTLSHYFKTYAHDAYEIYRDAAGPVTERTFSLPLLEAGDLRIELFGTIDFVLKNLATGALLPGDHKTSSQLGKDFLNRIKPNHQYTGYILGAQQALGLECENFMVNAIQVKPRPLTARGTPPTFTRQITVRTPADIAEFKDTVEWSVRSYLEWKKSGKWPLGSVDACSLWGGCSFLDVCSAPNELRQNILESKYVRP